MQVNNAFLSISMRRHQRKHVLTVGSLAIIRLDVQASDATCTCGGARAGEPGSSRSSPEILGFPWRLSAQQYCNYRGSHHQRTIVCFNILHVHRCRTRSSSDNELCHEEKEEEQKQEPNVYWRKAMKDARGRKGHCARATRLQRTQEQIHYASRPRGW